MERLTEKQSAGYDLKALNGEWCNHYCHKQRVETCNECGIYQAIQKLAYYEDLEDEGRLIILSVPDNHPCSDCNVGWCSIENEGCISCHDTCARLKLYWKKHET